MLRCNGFTFTACSHDGDARSKITFSCSNVYALKKISDIVYTTLYNTCLCI